MSERTETTKDLHLFSGLSVNDSAELTQGIMAEVNTRLRYIIDIIEEIETEGFDVNLDALPNFLENDATQQIGVFEKDSPYLGLHALLSGEISQEQLLSLSEQERHAFALFLESLTEKQVSSSNNQLERMLKEFSTFMYFNGLKIEDPSLFVSSLRDGVAQIRSKKSSYSK